MKRCVLPCRPPVPNSFALTRRIANLSCHEVDYQKSLDAGRAIWFMQGRQGSEYESWDEIYLEEVPEDIPEGPPLDYIMKC